LQPFDHRAQRSRGSEGALDEHADGGAREPRVEHRAHVDEPAIDGDSISMRCGGALAGDVIDAQGDRTVKVFVPGR
jgi:hypothetical protein